MNLIVQIKCNLGATYDLAARIVDEVTETSFLYSISGQFDLIAMFRIDDDIDPGIFINETLHRLPGVKDSHTTIAFNAFNPKR